MRPSHLRWGPLGLVALGGAVGASAREVVSLLIPDLGALPIAIPIVNIVGAFLLGYLYEAVTRLGPGDSRAKNLKLLLGTGFCGGFTTYSSLATDTAVLNANGHARSRVRLRPRHSHSRRIRHLGRHRSCSSDEFPPHRH